MHVVWASTSLSSIIIVYFGASPSLSDIECLHSCFCSFRNRHENPKPRPALRARPCAKKARAAVTAVRNELSMSPCEQRQQRKKKSTSLHPKMPVNLDVPTERASGGVVTSTSGSPASEVVQYCYLLSPEMLDKQEQNIRKLCRIAVPTGRGGWFHALQDMLTCKYINILCLMVRLRLLLPPAKHHGNISSF